MAIAIHSKDVRHISKICPNTAELLSSCLTLCLRTFDLQFNAHAEETVSFPPQVSQEPLS